MDTALPAEIMPLPSTGSDWLPRTPCWPGFGRPLHSSLTKAIAAPTILQYLRAELPLAPFSSQLLREAASAQSFVLLSV